jgi:hypothetical protein
MSRAPWRALAVLCTVIAGGAIVLAPAALAKPKPKPDLALARARISSQKYALTGQRVIIRVVDTTENVGHAAADGTVNRLTLHHHGAESMDDLTRKVPKLGKGKEDTGIGKAQIDVPTDAELGAYQATLCVDAGEDVKEEDEVGNNCDSLGKFYVAKARWRGSFGGTSSPFGAGVTETWRASDARFEPPKYEGDGAFTYKLAQATITYHDSGSIGGCTFAGSGVDGSPSGNLRLDYSAEMYAGDSRNVPGFSYPVLETCNGSTYVAYNGPASGQIPFVTGAKNLPFGSKKLAGSFTGGTNTYNWNLG